VQAVSDTLPLQGRLAAIDYGRKRLGIAICDPGRIIASPLENYTRRSQALDADWLQKLLRTENVVGIVVGLPVHLAGHDSVQSVEARQFGKWVGEVTSLPVCFQDERFSSAAADEMLGLGQLTSKKRKQRRDMLAAQVILASYLESTRSQSNYSALED
jgi:putative Holliday junction resolvase